MPSFPLIDGLEIGGLVVKQVEALQFTVYENQGLKSQTNGNQREAACCFNFRWDTQPKVIRIVSTMGLPPLTFRGLADCCFNFRWVWVKTNGIPFWLVGEFATHFRTYFSGWIG